MKDFVHLPSSQALIHGCDLWVLPPPKESLWTKEIDFYLNFQISKTFDPKTPLLILSLNRLPSKKNIVFSFFSNGSEIIYKKWLHLQKPSMRIFLPFFLTFKDVFGLFSHFHFKIQFVEEKKDCEKR